MAESRLRYDAERAEVELVSEASEGRYAGVHRFAALEFLARRVDHLPAKGEPAAGLVATTRRGTRRHGGRGRARPAARGGAVAGTPGELMVTGNQAGVGMERRALQCILCLERTTAATAGGVHITCSVDEVAMLLGHRLLAAISAAILGLARLSSDSDAAGTVLAIPVGAPARIDGSVKTGEWADADSLAIAVGPGWIVPVLLKHDGLTLYVAFTNLVHSSRERYPEIFLDIDGDRSMRWSQDDWWLHASYSDCYARGRMDDYETCAQVQTGWSANNFPLRSGTVEFRVDLGYFGVRSDTSRAGPGFGLAFDVMEDVNGERVSSVWPTTGQVLMPYSWAHARLSRAARPTRAR